MPQGQAEQEENNSPKNEKVELEKGDLPAMFIAAIIVVGPFFLIIIGVLLFLGWLFGAFR